MNATYNEIEPFCVEWLRNLIDAGHIASGIVDPRSVRDVETCKSGQAHFFAGLGAWSYALRLAGWPDHIPAWTGSCPCQPFSQAGRRKGTADERHLWPEWFRLIRACKPPIVFGEQVASPDGLAWLDSVLSDLETEGYEVGAADLCAAGLGAPHIRQRLYFVAIARGKRREELRLHLQQWQSRETRETSAQAARGCTSRALADHHDIGRRTRRASKANGRAPVEPSGLGDAHKLGDSNSARPPIGPGAAKGPRPLRVEGTAFASTGALRGFWSDADWIWCQPESSNRDGKYRPVEPGSFPLAHGASARVGRLRTYGNAIVPEVAATFIQAVIESLNHVA